MMRLAGLLGLLALTACESWPMKENVLFREMGVGCTRNADCSSGLCVDYETGPYKPGSCVPESAIVYVDLDRCDKTDMGQPNGTTMSPYCQINDAILNHAINASNQIIQVRPSLQAYESLIIPPVPYATISAAIIGPWADPALNGLAWNDKSSRPRATIRSSKGLTSVEVYEQMYILLDGFETGAIRDGANGVFCGGRRNDSVGNAKLSIRRLSINGIRSIGSVGILSGYDANTSAWCDMSIDRVHVNDHGTGVYVASKTLSFSMSNSMVSNNSRGIVVVAGLSAPNWKFIFNGIIDNVGMNSSGVYCYNRTIIENSIVWRNSIVNGSQIVNCIADAAAPVVVGATGQAGEVFSKKDPDLTPDFKLKPTIANRECCIDKVVPGPSTPKFDFFGNPRPQNGKADVGFHELIP